MIRTYESIFICPGELSQEKIEAALEKTKAVVSRQDGKIITAELWGRRKLAYPIDHHREGFYVYMIFTAPPQVLAQLDHHYRVTDTILRGLTVKVDPRNVDKIKPALRAQQAQEGAPEATVAGTPQAPQSVEAAVPAPAESKG